MGIFLYVHTAGPMQVWGQFLGHYLLSPLGLAHKGKMGAFKMPEQMLAFQWDRETT